MANVRNEPRPNTLITLYVDTENIPEPGNPILDHILFTDTNGDATNNRGTGATRFETGVKKGGMITWVGAVMNPEQALNKYVLITNITDPNGNLPVNGLNNLSTMPYQPGTHMSAQINPWANIPTDEISYQITFHLHTIDDKGKDTYKEYQIDPRLRIH